jgi:ATP-binding cassette subfamily F protein 3
MKGEDMFLSFGSEVIYDDANFRIEEKDKVGVVGVNGAGKTTLFKIILKEERLDGGKVTTNKKKIGYLPQEISFQDQDTIVLDYLSSARPIEKLENKLNTIYEKLPNASEKEQTKLLHQAETIQNELDSLHQYSAEDELLSIIDNMKIESDLLEMKVGNLSGGQKSKIAFARLLYENADILLLDEPTNHLDMKTKDFITNYLKNYHGMVLVISHDIDFLNEVITKTMFINKVTHKIKVYKGNYTEFKRLYADEMMQKELRIKEQEREIKHLQEVVKKAESASRTNHNIKRLGQSRKKMLEKKLDELETREETYKAVTMKIDPLERSGKIPLEVNHLTFHYPNKKDLYRNLSFQMARGEKFLIVGENGVGKSTLLKLIMKELTPIQGEITYGYHASIAYYAQELEILDENKTILENIDNPNYNDQELRTFLGNFLFSNNDVFKKVSVLSPGEKARVALCKILIQRTNIIILDEPTNHFDPETQAIIGENFKNYTGTLIMVSHNPAFVEQVGVTRMLVLPEGKIVEYKKELLHYYYYLNTELV